MGKITLIIQREYNQRVRKRSFILTTILTPILLVGLMVVPVLMSTMSPSESRSIVVVDQSGQVAPMLGDDGNVTFRIDPGRDYGQALASAEYSDAFGFLVVGGDIVDNPSDMQLYTRGSSTIGIEGSITRQVSSIVERIRIDRFDIPQLDSIMNAVHAKASLATFQIGSQSDAESGGAGSAKASSSAASMAIGYIAGFMIYMFIFLYGTMVMHGVIEEKSSRIIEVIVSSVRPFQLMMGKITGIALVALTQVCIWAVLIGVFFGAMQMSSADAVGAMTSGAAMDMGHGMSGIMQTVADPSYLLMILGGFVIFFIGGYLLYAAMFAAVGSAVDSTSDTQQLQLPITIPLILAILVMMNAMRDPHGPIAFWFSMIPFTSPIIMLARIPYGIPAWEIALSAALLYGTFIAMTWLAGKIYRVGIFMYGKKPSLKEVIKWARYKV